MGHLNTSPIPSAPIETADIYPEAELERLKTRS